MTIEPEQHGSRRRAHGRRAASPADAGPATTRTSRPRSSRASHGADAEPFARTHPAPGGRAVLALLWGVAVAVVAADQLTKLWAVAALSDGHRVNVLGDWLTLYLIRNPGAAFSFATGQTWIFTIIAVAVAVIVVRVSHRLASRAWAVTLGLVLGGAVGNLIDRLVRSPGVLRGHVVDFISYGSLFIGNVADIAIVVAAFTIMALSLVGLGLDGSRASGERRDGEKAAVAVLGEGAASPGSASSAGAAEAEAAEPAAGDRPALELADAPGETADGAAGAADQRLGEDPDLGSSGLEQAEDAEETPGPGALEPEEAEQDLAADAATGHGDATTAVGRALDEDTTGLGHASLESEPDEVLDPVEAPGGRSQHAVAEQRRRAEARESEDEVPLL